VIDCADPARLGEFWAAALGYQRQDPPAGFDSWPQFLQAQGVPEAEWNSANALVDPDGTGPRLFLQRVPEPKAAKNRVHLDVNVSGGHSVPAAQRQATIAEHVARLTGLGATRVDERSLRGDYWVVMQDPEGNEFCLQ
jgi:hypothetical protein